MATRKPPRTPQQIRGEINQFRTFHRATLALLVIASGTAASVVVSTTMAGHAYSDLALTLWCGIPVAYLVMAAFSTIGLRDHFARGITDRRIELLHLGELDPVETRRSDQWIDSWIKWYGRGPLLVYASLLVSLVVWVTGHQLAGQVLTFVVTPSIAAVLLALGYVVGRQIRKVPPQVGSPRPGAPAGTGGGS